MTCPASTVYSGTAKTPCTATAGGVGGLNATVPVTHSNNTNAGTAGASATYPGDTNHTGSTGTGSFTIEQAPSTTLVMCPASRTYTGSPLEACSASATGAGISTPVPVAVEYTDNTNVGTARANATYPGDANHTGSTHAGTFTIEKAASTTVVTCPATLVYTGGAQTPCTAQVTGAGGLDEAVSVTHTDNINAGTAGASATYAGDDNHLGSTGTRSFTITRAPTTVTVTCPTSVNYTGLPITPCTALATGAGGLSQSRPVTHTSNTQAGTANATASYAGDANHEPGSGSATFQITKWWTLKGFYQPVDMSGVLNTVKGGSTVPLKFEMFAGATKLTDVAQVKSFTATKVGCLTGAVEDQIEEFTTTGGTVLRYDGAGGQFIQNWQTPKTPGVCYRVTMTAQDSSTISALFKLK